MQDTFADIPSYSTWSLVLASPFPLPTTRAYCYMSVSCLPSSLCACSPLKVCAVCEDVSFHQPEYRACTVPGSTHQGEGEIIQVGFLVLVPKAANEHRIYSWQIEVEQTLHNAPLSIMPVERVCKNGLGRPLCCCLSLSTSEAYFPNGTRVH